MYIFIYLYLYMNIYDICINEEFKRNEEFFISFKLCCHICYTKLKQKQPFADVLQNRCS